LTVGAGATQDIAFRLVPQGELSGYVAADPTEFSRPAGIYEPPHAKLRINAMTLEGAGASRVLTRHGEQLRDLAGCYVDGQDRMAQAGFCFVGLPQGDYRLTIDAEGYRPFVMQQRVMPGKPSLLKPIVLEPLRPAR
jgi:hypothetical protein